MTDLRIHLTNDPPTTCACGQSLLAAAEVQRGRCIACSVRAMYLTPQDEEVKIRRVDCEPQRQAGDSNIGELYT